MCHICSRPAGPVFLGCLPRDFLKQAYEIRNVIEAQLIGNVLVGGIFGDKHDLGFFYFLLVDIL